MKSKLADWLSENRIARSEFARRIGLSPGRITQICNGETPSLQTALRIKEETGGAITADDLLQKG